GAALHPACGPETATTFAPLTAIEPKPWSLRLIHKRSTPRVCRRWRRTAEGQTNDQYDKWLQMGGWCSGFDLARYGRQRAGARVHPGRCLQSRRTGGGRVQRVPWYRRPAGKTPSAPEAASNDSHLDCGGGCTRRGGALSPDRNGFSGSRYPLLAAIDDRRRILERFHAKWPSGSEWHAMAARPAVVSRSGRHPVAIS